MVGVTGINHNKFYFSSGFGSGIIQGAGDSISRGYGDDFYHMGSDEDGFYSGCPFLDDTGDGSGDSKGHGFLSCDGM